MDPQKAVELLGHRLAEAQETLRYRRGDRDWKSWHPKTEATLRRIFGDEHRFVERFGGISWSLSAWTNNTPRESFEAAFYRGLEAAIGLLEAAIFDQETLAEVGDPADDNIYDPELWSHVGHLVEGRRWEQVGSQTAIFVESKVREWSGLGPEVLGQDLMSRVFKSDGGIFVLGRTKGEQKAWINLALGVSGVGNVPRHNIDARPDAKRFALGLLGAASLLLTQLRYEHGNQFGNAPRTNDRVTATDTLRAVERPTA